jgi:hypothetical protein
MPIAVLEAAAKADHADALLDRLARLPGRREMHHLVPAADERGSELAEKALGAAAYLRPAEGMGEGDPHSGAA